tara:strand:+ start:98 stop:376 length:279 start_codon:yes stop_codon:yes gene_type:complete
MKHPTIPKEKPFIDEHRDPELGDLIKLYNLYREITIEEPSIIGVYVGRGSSGQFSYYEILVIEDNEFKDYMHNSEGKVQRYLINDFIMCKCA